LSTKTVSADLTRIPEARARNRAELVARLSAHSQDGFAA